MSKYIVGLFNESLNLHECFNFADDSDKFLVSYLNPCHALKFDKKSDAQDFIDKYITNNNFDILPLNEIQAKYSNWSKNGGDFRRIPIKNQQLSRKYNGESPDEVLKWWIEIQRSDETSVSYEDYKTWPRLNEKFEHIFSTISYYSLDRKSLYHSFQMRVNFDSHCNIFKQELDKIIDYITDIDKNDGSKIIQLFDHYLSQGGNTAYFHIHKGGKYDIRSTRGRLLCEKNTLLKVFAWWKENRPYETRSCAME